MSVEYKETRLLLGINFVVVCYYKNYKPHRPGEQGRPLMRLSDE
jgi:hypothetical protein